MLTCALPVLLAVQLGDSTTTKFDTQWTSPLGGKPTSYYKLHGLRLEQAMVGLVSQGALVRWPSGSSYAKGPGMG